MTQLLTGLGTHKATAEGYAVDQETGFGTLCRQGDTVPANVPVSQTWMIKADDYRGPPARDPRSGGGLKLEL